MIHCIGDSHTSIFSGLDRLMPLYPKIGEHILTEFITYRFLTTLYNMESTMSSILDIVDKNIVSNDSILFSYGEVDCRRHVIKQSEAQNRSISEIISDIISKYQSNISMISNHIKVPIKNIYIYNIIGTGYPVEYKYSRFYGTMEQINILSREFNKQLKKMCDDNNFIFIDIFDKMVTQDNKTMPGIFIADGFHLSTIFLPHILEEINKNG